MSENGTFRVLLGEHDILTVLDELLEGGLRSSEHKRPVPVENITSCSAAKRRRTLQDRQRQRLAIYTLYRMWRSTTSVLGQKRDRGRNMVRDREAALARLLLLSPERMRAKFRVHKDDFWLLVEQVRPYVETEHTEMAIASSGTFVPVELQLAATLRWLAGSSHIDACDVYGIGEGGFFYYVWGVCKALNRVLVISFPLDDSDKLRTIAQGFHTYTKGQITGCVGAVDGIVVRTRAPHQKECGGNIMQYRNRKHCFGMVAQAVCDAKLKFLFVSMRACGSTHDWVAWQLTALHKAMQSGSWPKDYFIVGDDAYVCNETLITPFPGRGLEESKDTFNYYQSLCRNPIERAFGVLVARWGVFWRPLQVGMRRWALIFTVCCKLHNLCVDRNLIDVPTDPEEDGKYRTTEDDVAVRFTHLHQERASQGRRTDLEVSMRRLALCRTVHDNGIGRPYRGTARFESHRNVTNNDV